MQIQVVRLPKSLESIRILIFQPVIPRDSGNVASVSDWRRMLPLRGSGVSIMGFLNVTPDSFSGDGAYHDVDSSVMAFEIAARTAFRELVMSAKPKLLEPIMRVEVVTPEDYVGDVMGDLNRRRGHITGTGLRGNAQVVGAMVPLANMFGYVNNLRSATQGRAQFTMHFDHYEQVPQAVSDEVRAKLA